MTSVNQPAHGGKRTGAGRPTGTTKPATKPRAIRMTDHQHTKYIELGGARWVKRLIDEYIDSTVKPHQS